MLVVKQLLSTRNTNPSILTDEGQKCEGKGGLNANSWIKIPVPISTVKIHIITELSLFSFYFIQINGDLFFIWHSNEHKTRRDLNSRNMGVCKKILKGENDGEMSKAEEKDRFLHGAKAWLELC